MIIFIADDASGNIYWSHEFLVIKDHKIEFMAYNNHV